jgi:D-beta-D-heptose 7-phosphate kinase/D-beta-D-heptose 1-phosphate adenosyltransferase
MKIGFCNGCFDGFHAGHEHFLTQALKHCHYLIVALNDDTSILRLKGPPRPIRTRAQRFLAVWGYLNRLNQKEAHYRGRPFAVIPFNGDVVPLIALIRPDVIIRGEDQSDEGYPLAPVVKIARLPGISTTQILRNDHYRDATGELVLPKPEGP